MRVLVLICVSLLGIGIAFAQDRVHWASLPIGLGSCYAPAEPFPYKLEKSDPLFETARDEHQRYLEDLEDYVNCLDQERAGALAALRGSFDLFLSNFGENAVLKYAQEREASGQ